MFAAGFKRIDLLGVAIIGIATGLGGGLLRDILLGVSPIAFQSNPYLITATLAALAGMLLQRVVTKLDPVITVLDALTIGLFAAIGTTKSLSLGLPIVPSILIGCVSAVGGSMLRDLLLSMPIALMHVGSLYAVAAIAGSGVLVLCLVLGVQVTVAAGVCVVVTFVIRLLAVRYGWSLPEQRALSRIRRKRREAAEDARVTTGSSRPMSLRRRRILDTPAGHGSQGHGASGLDGRTPTTSIPVVRPSAARPPTSSIKVIRQRKDGQPPTGSTPRPQS
nr:TRIC cation channel family protein [Lysinibacter cavernae]